MTDETGPEAAVKGVAEDVKGKVKEAAGAVTEMNHSNPKDVPSRTRRPQSARSRLGRPRPRTPALRHPPPRLTSELINRRMPRGFTEPPSIRVAGSPRRRRYLLAEAHHR